jgi:hypothetical protein
MKIQKRLRSSFLTLLVVSLGFREIDSWGDFGMQTAIKSWSGWTNLVTYWYIPFVAVGLACLIYFFKKAYGWIKLKLVMLAIAWIKAVQAAANANQPTGGNPPSPTPPAPATPPAGNPPTPAPTAPPAPTVPPASQTQAAATDEYKGVPAIHFYASFALSILLTVGLSYMVYLYIDQLDKNSERMKANYSLESKIIKKQQEIAQQFGVPLPPMTTEADVMKADPKQLFLGGGCDFFNVQVPDKKQKYRELVKGTRAANACVIDGNTVPDETAENYSIEEPTEPEPTVTPPVTKPKTKPAAPATSTPDPKPAVKAKTGTETGRRTFGSSYTPPTANQQTGEWQGAQGTPGSSSGNFSPEGKVYTLGEPNPPTPHTQPSDGGTVFHPF